MTNVKTDGLENICGFKLKIFVYLDLCVALFLMKRTLIDSHSAGRKSICGTKNGQK